MLFGKLVVQKRDRVRINFRGHFTLNFSKIKNMVRNTDRVLFLLTSIVCGNFLYKLNFYLSSFEDKKKSIKRKYK